MIAQSKMIFRSVIIILAIISLGSTTVEGQDKRNPDRFLSETGNASKMLQKISTMQDASTEEIDKFNDKRIDLFELLPDQMVENDHRKDRKLPIDMLSFFLPAKKIIPRQYKKRERP